MGLQPKEHIQDESTFTTTPMNHTKYEHTTPPKIALIRPKKRLQFVGFIGIKFNALDLFQK
jgi:hypothetical protein